MPLTILRTLRSRLAPPAFFFTIALAAMLSACAGGPSPAASNVRYDLGVAPAPASTGSLPPVKVLGVSAAKNLDTDSIIYRLQYADAQQSSSYTFSHWTMPPAELFTQRLRAALAARGPVLTGADPVRAPTLQVELTSFEQVFDAPGQSRGAVSARATLSQHGQVLSQRTFVAQAPSASADAAGAARALAAASDALIAQMAAWLATQPLAAAQ